MLLGLFGAALLYGDGIITPAISVLAAVEGTAVAAPDLSHIVVPTAVVIIVLLFAVQRRGTASIGRVFGPVMVVWFATIGVLGGAEVVAHPDVFRAISPSYAVRFFADNGLTGFLVLGAVILVVVGGEALYADMGHFGRRPIPHRLVRGCAPEPVARLLRARRAAAPRSQRGREPVLSTRARLGAVSARGRCDRGDRDSCRKR